MKLLKRTAFYNNKIWIKCVVFKNMNKHIQCLNNCPIQ